MKAEKNVEQVSSIVEEMSASMDSLVTNLRGITNLIEEDENVLDTIEKLFEGVEIFLTSTSPELEKNNEVRRDQDQLIFCIDIYI